MGRCLAVVFHLIYHFLPTNGYERTSLFFFNLIAFALNEYNHHVLSSLRLGTAVLPHHTILTDFLFFYFFLDFFYKEWLDSVRILEGQPARHILIKTN